MLALGGSVPISPYVTTLSFLIYLVCRLVGGLQGRGRRHGRETATGPVAR